MKDEFKSFFGINDKEDIEKVDKYLQLFDDDLKSPNSKDALDWQKRANEGDIYAILQYAQMLFIGYGTLINKEEAFKYWKKGADLGNSLAMYNVAFCLRHGFGIQKNINESIRYYKMAAEKGNSNAMINLGHIFCNGEGITANEKEAYKYYTMAASHGNVNALINIGRMFYEGKGMKENKKLGLQFFKKAADLGNEQAMYVYGHLFIGDSIITKNISELEFNDAMKYLKMSADKGYVDAMIEYAMNKILKEGYNFCDPEIARYLRMGADHGNEKCKELLSLNGIDNNISNFLNQSPEELKELADKGDVHALFSFGKMLYSGENVEQDKEEAANYFKKAADLGDSHAMFE